MVTTNNNNYKQEDKVNYCSICAKNGFPKERIIFKAEGIRSDGSKLWILYDYYSQSQRHIHKSKQENNTNSVTSTIDREQSNLAQCRVQQYIDTIGPVVTKNLTLSEESKDLLLTLIDMVKKIAKAMAV